MPTPYTISVFDIRRWQESATTPQAKCVTRCISDFILGFSFEEAALECGLSEGEYLETFEQYNLIQSIFVNSMFSVEKTKSIDFPLSSFETNHTLISAFNVKVYKSKLLEVSNFHELLGCDEFTKFSADTNEVVNLRMIVSKSNYLRYVDVIQIEYRRKVTENENMYTYVTEIVKSFLYSILTSKDSMLAVDSKYKYLGETLPHVNEDCLGKLVERYVEEARYVRETTSFDLERRHKITLERLDTSDTTIFGKDPFGRKPKPIKEKTSTKRWLFSVLHSFLYKLENAL